MTSNPLDFSKWDKSKKSHIQRTNGKQVEVEGHDLIDISDKIKLPNYLFIPNLSHKLLSFNQLTK